MGFAAHHALGAEHGRRTADRTARGGHQRRVGIHLHQAPQRHAQQQRRHHHDRIDRNGRQTDGRHLGERKPETVEHDTQPQQLLRTEPDARHPRLGQVVAQAVGIDHTEQDTHDQRTEREFAHEVEFGDVERRKREKSNEQNAVQHIAPLFVDYHINSYFNRRIPPPPGPAPHPVPPPPGCRVRAFYGRTHVAEKTVLHYGLPGLPDASGSMATVLPPRLHRSAPQARPQPAERRRAARLLSSRPHRRRPGRRTTGDATCRRASSSCPRRPRPSSSCASARTASSGGSRRPSSYPSPARCVRGAGR